MGREAIHFESVFRVAEQLQYVQIDQVESLVDGVEDHDYYNINALEEIKDVLESAENDYGIDVDDTLIFCKRMIAELEVA